MKDQALNFILSKFKLTALKSLNDDSGLKSLGWFESYYQAKPIDKDGNPIPWFTYSAIHFLTKKLDKKFPTLDVFEYGSGFSSLWWANRVHLIHSVEHDSLWYEKMKENKFSNFQIHHKDVNSADYVDLPKRLGIKFDVIVVDGRRRNDCMKASSECLKDNGIIILDNSNREDYQDGLSYLKNLGFSQVEFSGMTPMGTELSETSVLFRQNNIFDI